MLAHLGLTAGRGDRVTAEPRHASFDPRQGIAVRVHAIEKG
jgi:hypothetical protein